MPLWALWRQFLAIFRLRVLSPSEFRQTLAQRAEKVALKSLSVYAGQEPAVWASQRKQAALLIEAVLNEQMSPTQALVRWPVENKDAQLSELDPSLQAVYQMLWHLEADEAPQQQELFYLDTQLALLNQAALAFAKGKPLPAYLLEVYTLEHQARFYMPQTYLNVLYDFLQKPVGLLQTFWRSIRQVCHF